MQDSPAISIWDRVCQPKWVFLTLTLLFGMSFVFLVPPFQVPDEPEHFWRAYQISRGQFIAEQRGDQVGGDLPDSVVRLKLPYDDVAFHPDVKMSRAVILDSLRVPLDRRRHGFYPFLTSRYSPVTYIPQTLAISLGRRLKLPPLAMLYLGRVFTLLTWTALGMVTLSIAPAGRRALMLLLVMPMTLFLAASVSVDVITNAMAALVTVLIWKHATADPNQRITAKEMAVLVVATLLLTLSKFAYLPMTVLVLLIPASRLGGRKQYWIAVAGLLLINVAVLGWWTSRTPWMNFVRPDVPMNPRAQLQFLRDHPMELVRLPIATAMQIGVLMLKEFVGVLGWLDTPLPSVMIWGFLIALVLACWPARSDGPIPPLGRLILLGLIAILVPAYLVLMVNSYILWTPVGQPLVAGMQGRYFIPAAPVWLMIFCSLAKRLPRIPDHYCNQAAAAVGLASCIGTAVILYCRYYVP